MILLGRDLGREEGRVGLDVEAMLGAAVGGLVPARNLSQTKPTL